jgi:hypothetical protein
MPCHAPGHSQPCVRHAPPTFALAARPPSSPSALQGMRKNALFQGFVLVDGGRPGLQGALAESGECGHVVDVGESGGLSGTASCCTMSYDAPMCDIVCGLVVRIDASSSSDMPDSVVRSEYEAASELTLVMDDAEQRIVSASDPELMVDMVRSEATLDRRSDPELDDVASPLSWLCAPQCTSGIDV